MIRSVLAGSLAAFGTLAAISDAHAGRTKLVVVSRPARSSAKVTYTSTDPVAGLSKGSGTDVATIDAQVLFEAPGGTASFTIPAGAYAGGAGWTSNSATRAAFTNRAAPAGSTGVHRTTLNVGRRVKLVAKSLGDATPLDVGTIAGNELSIAYVVHNDGETTTHCTKFPAGSCMYAPLDGGTGGRLRCKDGLADPQCGAIPTTTTTTTLLPSVCGNGILEPGEQCDSSPGCTASCVLTGLGSCCQGTDECVAAPNFSLQYYLYQWCGAYLPGSTPVAGQNCRDDGTCGDQAIDPVPLCCQQTPTTCYDGEGTSIAGLWYFQYYCLGGAGIGGGPFMAINASCGGDGTCVSN